MAYLSVQFPFLNIPVVKQLIRLVVNKILTIAIRSTELAGYFEIIDFKTGKEADDFKEVAEKHEKAKETGATKDEIEKLELAKIDAARNLIKFRVYLVRDNP